MLGFFFIFLFLLRGQWGTGCPKQLWMPPPRRHSRLSWMVLSSSWSSGRGFLPTARGLELDDLKCYFQPNHSVILWCDNAKIPFDLPEGNNNIWGKLDLGALESQVTLSLPDQSIQEIFYPFAASIWKCDENKMKKRDGPTLYLFPTDYIGSSLVICKYTLTLLIPQNPIYTDHLNTGFNFTSIILNMCLDHRALIQTLAQTSIISKC